MLMTICMVTRKFFDQKTRYGLPCLKQGLTGYNSVRPDFTPTFQKEKCTIKTNLKRNTLKYKHKKAMALIDYFYSIIFSACFYIEIN